ncbi:hypothetical protein, partial [Pantoea ananatis]|uniref:hypothetical protein n=2 Tax=Pantoea ananas TaxID=553 RepID=UPI001B304511
DRAERSAPVHADDPAAQGEPPAGIKRGRALSVTATQALLLPHHAEPFRALICSRGHPPVVSAPRSRILTEAGKTATPLINLTADPALL